MISKDNFTKEWILEVKGSERSDQAIIERQIYALHLLEEFTKEFTNFIFKGGTALSLISNEFPRFSIDIDILVDIKHKTFFTLDNLNKVLNHSEFTRVVENIRQPKHNIDKQHFEFYYDGVFGSNVYVLLDVVYAESHYHEIVDLEIKNRLLKQVGKPLKVKVPSIHDLLADKLCAYAPNTIGKKLGDGRDIEVIKQMFDVAYLFDHYPLNPTFHNIYKSIAKEEILSRELSATFKETVLDTIKTSLNIILEGKLDSIQYTALKSAIRRFVSFVRDNSFNVESAKICAIKNIFASLLVLTEGYKEFEVILLNQDFFLPEYKVFKSTKKWLRLTNPEQYRIFDNCLKVMTFLKIKITNP
ncbi:nucleotidyl transferase AbiEii/AbiGii toxin family protein [Mycoplasmatota bacterium WC30]